MLKLSQTFKSPVRTDQQSPSQLFFSRSSTVPSLSQHQSKLVQSHSSAELSFFPISCQFNYFFMKLKLLGPQVVYSRMPTPMGYFTLGVGDSQIFIFSLYLCRFSSDFYETLHLRPWGTKLFTPGCLPKLIRQKLSHSKIFKIFIISLYLCQYNSDFL